MGSCMSGNYGRRSFGVDFTDKLFCVDLLVLRRRGWLRSGTGGLGMCEIPQPTGRPLKAHAECNVDEDVGNLRLRFDFLPDLAIDLASTPQPLGGVRWWFVCPVCRSSRGKLFLGGIGTWGCRECHQLRYRSQHLRPAARARARCEWYCERADTFYWVAEPRRPRRMHRTTFARLLARRAHYRERWRELGSLPIEREIASFKEKFARRYARALGR